MLRWEPELFRWGGWGFFVDSLYLFRDLKGGLISIAALATLGTLGTLRVTVFNEFSF